MEETGPTGYRPRVFPALDDASNESAMETLRNFQALPQYDINQIIYYMKYIIVREQLFNLFNKNIAL